MLCSLKRAMSQKFCRMTMYLVKSIEFAPDLEREKKGKGKTQMIIKTRYRNLILNV